MAGFPRRAFRSTTRVPTNRYRNCSSRSSLRLKRARRVRRHRVSLRLCSSGVELARAGSAEGLCQARGAILRRLFGGKLRRDYSDTAGGQAHHKGALSSWGRLRPSIHEERLGLGRGDRAGSRKRSGASRGLTSRASSLSTILLRRVASPTSDGSGIMDSTMERQELMALMTDVMQGNVRDGLVGRRVAPGR